MSQYPRGVGLVLISIAQQGRKFGLLSFMSKFNTMVGFFVFKIFNIKNPA